MTHDAPTETNPTTAAQFRAEVQREQWKLVNETRQSLHDLHAKISHIEAVLKNTQEDVRELKIAGQAHHKHDVEIAELQHWRENMKDPFAAAEKLAQATTGARMIMLGIFGLATGILAVAGVMQLMSGVWHRFFSQ